MDESQECPICSFPVGFLTAKEKDVHFSICMPDQKHNDKKETTTDEGDNDGLQEFNLGKLFFCYVCGKDLTSKCSLIREGHINRCLDREKVLQSGLSGKASLQDALAQIGLHRQNFECPFCEKNLSRTKVENRVLHVKKCGSNHARQSKSVAIIKADLTQSKDDQEALITTMAVSKVIDTQRTRSDPASFNPLYRHIADTSVDAIIDYLYPKRPHEDDLPCTPYFQSSKFLRSSDCSRISLWKLSSQSQHVGSDGSLWVLELPVYTPLDEQPANKCTDVSELQNVQILSTDAIEPEDAIQSLIFLAESDQDIQQILERRRRTSNCISTT
eukprot:TRINITY_DN9499_c0_g1_i1.p1 TRINITY_DN9499_c0_g1~~TRINITY_DN9499_c0_g1_i1.p1  ORF type:complete len:329 (-),score=56.37 TRINITY_DN9499_c0_g1_i1:495-1481(-)